MVCLGNICRSPLAEGILKHYVLRAGLSWQVDSAGTNGFHTGEPPHMLSQKVARLHGIDISHQRARKFEAADFDTYDKIYAMAEDVIEEMKIIAGKKYQSEKVSLLLEEIFPGQGKEVPDPWYGPEPGYHEVFSLIDEACACIVNKHINTRLLKKETTLL